MYKWRLKSVDCFEILSLVSLYHYWNVKILSWSLDSEQYINLWQTWTEKWQTGLLDIGARPMFPMTVITNKHRNISSPSHCWTKLIVRLPWRHYYYYSRNSNCCSFWWMNAYIMNTFVLRIMYIVIFIFRYQYNWVITSLTFIK